MKNKEVVDKWVNRPQNIMGSSIYGNKDAFYSFGDHFPIAVALENGEILCNADKWGTTRSAQHQGLFFDHYLPHIPFSALNMAIQNSSSTNDLTYIKRIEILDKVKDKQEKIWNPKTESNVWKHKPGVVLVRTSTYRNTKQEAEIYLLCGMDDNSYFVCQLPKPVFRIDEAFDSLKPDYIRECESKGIQVLRQGDIYFVRTKETVKQFLKGMNEDIKNRESLVEYLGDYFKRKTLDPAPYKKYFINDTHFSAFGVRRQYCNYIENKLQVTSENDYVWGTVKHSRGDHKQLSLKNDEDLKPSTQVYIAIPNLKVNAWGAKGNVD